MSISVVQISTVHFRFDVRIMYKYCHSLAEDGDYAVTLLVADGKGSVNSKGLEIEDLGRISKNRIRRFLSGNYLVCKKLIKVKKDIYQFHDPELLPSIVFLKLMGKNVVFDMHENLPLQILTKEYLPATAKKILSFFTKQSQRLVLRFVPVIFAEISYRKYFPKAKIHETILNFPLLKISQFYKTKKTGKFKFGYMGGVNIERGTLVILEAVDKLIRQGHDVEVEFVGPVNDEILPHKIYQDAVNNGWAKFYGRLKPEEGWSIMANCSVGLAVLQDSPNYVESYPTKLFEYMLLQLPVIVSNFPLYAKITKECECGIAVNPDSVEDVALAMTKMFKNSDMRNKMGINGKNAAEKQYNWESEYVKLKDFYHRTLNK